jgi:F-type H+-transporting ATPase subunit b
MLALDWRTVLFQIINFAVLVVILNYLVFRPLRRKLNERSGDVANALQNARDQEAEAVQLRATWEARMAEIELEREDILSQAKRQAEARTAELYRETRQRLDLITEQMRRDVQRQRSEVVSEHFDEMLDTIIELSANVVQSVTTRRAHDDLVNNLLAQVYQMPQDQVDAYRRVMAGRMPTAFVTTPVTLSPEQTRNLTDTVSSLADRRIELQVSVDPALIAGIQVRLGDRLLDNSIRNQLGRVRSRVSQELVEHLSLEERDAG